MNESLRDLSARVGYETLPRVNSFADDVSSAARSVDRAADTFSTNPRSVLFGAPAGAGTGRAGLHWPAKAAAQAVGLSVSESAQRLANLHARV